MLTIFATLLTAAFVTLGLTPVVRATAARLGIVDHPDGRRKLQSAAVPLGGGVAVLGGWFAGLANSAWWLPGSAASCWTVMLAAGLLVAVGLLDDARGLRPLSKLCGQVVAVIPLAWSGAFPQAYAFAGFEMDLGSAAPVWHVLWLVACINAMNFLDGMDGFAVTIAAISAACIAGLASLNAASGAQLMSVAVLGAVIGFFPFNRPAATIYLGDAGSMLLGLILGTTAALAATPSVGSGRWLVPVALLAVPLWDAALAIARRLLARRSITAPDRGHLHHRFIQRGIAGMGALALVALLGLACGAAATASMLGHDLAATTAIATLFLILTLGRVVGNREAAALLSRLSAAAARLAHRLSDRRLPAAETGNRILHREMERLCDQLELSQLSLAIRQRDREVLKERVDRKRVSGVPRVPPDTSPQWSLTVQAAREASSSCAVTAGFAVSNRSVIDDAQLVEQLALLAEAGAGLAGTNRSGTLGRPRRQPNHVVRRAA